jgi:hypothetical protein
MPNAAGRSLKRGYGPQPVSLEDVLMENSEENPKLSTAVADRPPVQDFTGAIEAAPEGYSPDRSPAGRTRIPSQFEDVLPGLKDKGWQRIKHDGRVEMIETDNGRLIPDPATIKVSNAHVITRELRKAQHHLKLGMDLNVNAEYVEFKIRELQKRKARAGEKADDEGNVVDEEIDDEYDETDEDED